MLVELKGLSSRAKNRIREHGSIMKLLETTGTSILVESQNNTWHGEKWMGWFDWNDVSIKYLES